MSTFSVTDHAFTLKPFDPASCSGHESLLALSQVLQAAEASDLFGQSRPEKPWLDGCSRTIYVEATPDVDCSCLRNHLLSMFENKGSRHWGLCDAPLLRLPGQRRLDREDLPPNVIPVLRQGDPEYCDRAWERRVLRDAAKFLCGKVLFPGEWLIADLDDTNDLDLLDDLSHRTATFFDRQSVAIHANRPWPFPGRGLADLSETERRGAMRFREIPDWLKARP